MNKSRNTPEHVTTTSTRGLPSFSSGISSSLFTRPIESGTGRTPSNMRTWASDSPYVLMLSVPHRVKATDSGKDPESAFIRSNKRSTTTRATSTAAFVGIDCGSRPCMFLPVGRTSGLRIGSPPGPGVMNLPSSASISPPTSLSATTCFRQNSKYSNSGVMSNSFTFGNPASLRAFFTGLPPVIELKKFIPPFIRGDTVVIRPLPSVD
mmetsp:Transcript_2728/g.2883  ORF Transcript_2728/g.2883 Transcript_2728/m.2883 type:complete len:208 (+) Transcript_2728:1052-1675(+)